MPVTLSQVLSVTLALAVIYYVLGLIVSTLVRVIMEALETRGKTLEAFLKKNLTGAAEAGKQGLLERLKETPQLNSLKPVRYANFIVGFFTGETEIANVIERVPAKNLVDALFDLAGMTQAGKEKLDDLIALLPDQLPGGRNFAIKNQLKNLSAQGFADMDQLRSKMETWVGDLLDQASQEFKAQARRWVIFLSFGVTIVLGVDSIELAQKYWQDATISATANAQASLILQSTDNENAKNADAQELIGQLEEMKAIDYGWYVKPGEQAWLPWLVKKILGLLITALAVSQGSSFWYDFIKQLKGEQPPAAPETAANSAP